MAPFIEAHMLFNSLVSWIFNCIIYLRGTIRMILSCRGESHVPVWCQLTDDRRRFYFGFRALIESIWNDESNEIEISRFDCNVAKIWFFEIKIWIFRNCEYFHWKSAIFPLKKEARRLDQCEVCGGVRTQVFWMNRVAWGRDNMLASSKVDAVGGTNTRSKTASKSNLAVKSFEKWEQKIRAV